MVDDDKHYLGNSQTSQLCKPLSAVLRDSAPLSMLDYFVQYMETEGALHLLQFWFAIETFKNVTSIYNSPNHVKDYRPNNPIVDHQCKQCCSVSVESGVSVCNRMTSVEGSEVDNLIGEENSVTCETRNDSIPSSTLTPKTESTTRAVNGQAVERSGRGKEITQCGSSASIKGQDSATFSQAAPDGMHIQQQQRLLKQLSLNLSSDALSIYTTYIALNALSQVSIPDDIRQEIEVNICPEDGKVNRNCFDKAQAFVYHVLEERYYPGFLSSHELCKYQYEYISSGKVGLLDFLLSDNALFYFMEYMEQENSTSLVQFWLTAESFRSQISDTVHVPDIERDTADAIAIYERYFSLQASSPLHFGDTIRMDIENRICDEHGPRVDSYDTAQNQAYDLMNEFHFPGFLKSSVYLRFLNELVVTINRPSTVYTTSDHAESLGSASMVQQHPPNQSDFSQNLDDPYSLWKRPPAILRLGYMDEFGQYISEIELIPSKSLRQKGDSSKKFSWLGKSRDEEEIAMKIARTIVKEVLNGICRYDKSPCR